MEAHLIDHLAQQFIGCLTCNAGLRADILAHRFWLLVLTVAPVTLAGGFLCAYAARAYTTRVLRSAVIRGDDLHDRAGREMAERTIAQRLGASAWAVAMIGAALGALFDGILFHQVLQVHDMISNSLPPVTLSDKSVNVFWSGIFHLAVFALVMIGIASWWRNGQRLDARPPAGVFWGAFVFGWGAFNLYDTLTFHALLRYHDLVEVTDAPLAWNLAWGVMGLGLALLGLLAMSHGLRTAARSRAQGPTSLV